MNLNIIHLTRI